MEFNVQDLFLRLDQPIGVADLDRLNEDEWQLLGARDEELKPLGKLRGLAQVFREEDPDVAMLCEVGGPEALANFSRLFLADRYEPLATRPISDRGIETAYLVKRDLDFRRELISHADEPVHFLYPHEADPVANDVTALFASTLPLEPADRRKPSRDFPELRLYRGKDKVPSLVILLAHLKSAFDPHGIDKGGAARRAGEVEALLRVRARILTEFGPRTPLILSGDFNGRAGREATDPEFRPLYATTDLEDALELAGLPRYERISQITYFRDKGAATQIDFVMVPKVLHRYVDRNACYVHRFKFPEGDGTMALPGSMRDRWQLPSDHYPVVCTLSV